MTLEYPAKPLAWMTSYLTDRCQTVCIDGEQSNPVIMKYSVPQGSVLGPKTIPCTPHHWGQFVETME